MYSMDHIMYNHEYPAPKYGKKPSTSRKAVRFTCPNCSSRIWGGWEYPLEDEDGTIQREKADECFIYKWDDINRNEPPYSQIDKYHQEFSKFLDMESCPVCNVRLTKDTVRYNTVWWSSTFSKAFKNFLYLEKGEESIAEFGFSSLDAIIRKYCKSLAKASEEQGNLKYKHFLEQCTNAIVPKQRYILQDTQQVKDFLEYLISVEKNIYVTSERLRQLYNGEYERQVHATHSVTVALAKKKNEVLALHDNFVKKKEEKPTIPASALRKYPSKPIEPKAPEKPVLETPKWFNKKRVIAQNTLLMDQYEKDCALHTEALKEYSKRLTTYQEEVKQIDTQKEIELTKAKTAHAEECKELEQAYLSAKLELESSKTNVSTPQVLIQEALNKETAEAEKLLKELYQVRSQMYDSGVIFGKYHDFVAVSSFYEYLASGRCTSLEGTQGAYNLYENEIRMDAVISKLDLVLDDLESIRNNQYVIYSAIKESTNELKALNSTVAELSDTTKEIAYNTKVSAFYSKKTAELTETLCFLTALG